MYGKVEKARFRDNHGTGFIRAANEGEKLQEQSCFYVSEDSVGLQSSALKGWGVVQQASVNLQVWPWVPSFAVHCMLERLTSKTTLARKTQGNDLAIIPKLTPAFRVLTSSQIATATKCSVSQKCRCWTDTLLQIMAVNYILLLLLI